MTTARTLEYYMRQSDLGVPIRTRAEREERVEASKPHTYGGDASIAGLRAFIRYHKDARQDVEMGGRLRSLTHKQVAMHGLITRIAGSDQRHTITALAKEANVATSTLSRFLDKLQVWNVYAIDVTRGRSGGIRVRLRGLGDQLAAYAERAWLRVKQAAQKAISRTKLNVASVSQGLDIAVSTTTTVMDATFTENCDGRCSNLVDCSEFDKTPLPDSRTYRDALAERARALEFARDTIAEIKRLEAGEPDWDVYLDNVRASYGL